MYGQNMVEFKHPIVDKMALFVLRVNTFITDPIIEGLVFEFNLVSFENFSG
jgi:hypothetical protein